MALETLGYRPWKGRRRGPLLRFWPIARRGMALAFRRKVFRIFLWISLLSFLFTSSLIYLEAQLAGRLGYRMPENLKKGFAFGGKGEAYLNFITLQGTVVMIMLALLGGLLVGNDFRANALPFYLSRPIGKLDYFLGKLLAIAGLTSLITLAPALVLFLEYGAFSESFDYYRENLRLLGAIAGYGTLVSVVPALLLLAVASSMKKTVPTILAWAGLFVFLPAVVGLIRRTFQDRGLGDPWGWALLDLWADLRWISYGLFGLKAETHAERWPWAAAVLAAAALLSAAVFWRRISAVEVVR